MNTLKKTVFKAARSDEEFMALVITSQAYQLNPIVKEIYAFPAKGGGVVPMVSVDGWIAIMNRQANFDGLKVTVSPDGEEATAIIHLKDRTHPVEVTEYLSECSRPTDPWKKSPKRMLRHKATIQAIRVAFGISGIHDEDEAKDYAKQGEPRNVTKESNSEPIGKVSPFKSKAIEQETKTAEAVEVEAEQEVEQAEPPKHEEVKQEPFEVTLAAYKPLTGTSQKTGKPWKVHVLTLTNGDKTVEAKTFSNTIGGIAEYNVGSKAIVTLENTAKGVGILTFELVESAVEGGLC